MNSNNSRMQYRKEIEENGKIMKKPTQIVLLENKQWEDDKKNTFT